MQLPHITESRARLLAILAGVACAIAETRMQVPGFPARILIVAGLALGVLAPSRPWRWAVTMSLMLTGGILLRLVQWKYHILVVPQMTTLMAYLGQLNPNPPSVYQAIISFAPSMAACYLGQWFAGLSKPAKSSEAPSA